MSKVEMQKVILTVGIPGSGKSTWAKAEIKKDPNAWVRINNDEIRSMMNGSVFSKDYEKLITETRNFLIRQALRRGKNVIIDNVNINRRQFDDVVKIARSAKCDVQILEKSFYIDLQEAIDRDAKREGKAHVGEIVIKKFWKGFGKTQHQFYKPRTEIVTFKMEQSVIAMKQDENLPRAVIFDNDGTISLIHPKRSPYDASTCDLDAPHHHVIECMKLYYNAGYQVLFVSGREEKDRAPTERFYQQYFPEVKYKLFMRPTGDIRKDVIIKEEIFNNQIKNNYFVSGWFDDRLQVSKWVYENGLPLFRVNDPESNF